MTPIHELRQNALEAIEQARPLRVRCADRHHTLSLVEEKSLSASRPDPAGRLACAPRYADATTRMTEGPPIVCGNATVGSGTRLYRLARGNQGIHSWVARAFRRQDARDHMTKW